MSKIGMWEPPSTPTLLPPERRERGGGKGVNDFSLNRLKMVIAGGEWAWL